MDEQTTSVTAATPGGGGESSANSSIGDAGATTSTTATGPATGASTAVAAVDAFLAEGAGQQSATPVDAFAPATPATPKPDAAAEAAQTEEKPATAVLLDEQSFAVAPKDRQVQAFMHQRQQIQQLETEKQQFKADADLLGLAFSDAPAQFWDQITDSSPAAAINLLEAVISEAPDVVVGLLQKAGRLPAVDPNQSAATTPNSADLPADLPAELHEIWHTLSAEVRDEMSLMTPALRNRWLENENRELQKTRAEAQAQAEATRQGSAKRLGEYEERVWQAVMQQVGQEVPLTGDPKVDEQIYRLGALAAYYDLMPKDPTTMSLVNNVRSWLDAGERRNYEGAQVALIAAGKAATVKALAPIIEAFRKAARFDQLQQQQANPRLQVNGNGNGAGDASLGHSLNGLSAQEKHSAIAQAIAQQFNLPA